jgi:hypothetical protein
MNPYDDIEEVDELPAPPRKQLDPADFELLVLASRALGAIRVETVEGEQWVNLHFEDGSTMFGWNPLRHSDDTFNLIVKLRLTLEVFHDRAVAKTHFIHSGQAKFIFAEVMTGDDAPVATRRAITRAAAEIGKTVA